MKFSEAEEFAVTKSWMGTPLDEPIQSRIVTVNDEYHIIIPASECLLVHVSAPILTVGASFAHDNILAKRSEVFEFKHYKRSGYKFWTSQSGVSYYVAIPMDRIELGEEPEKGLSDVPVIINGQKVRLNSSGGSVGGWGIEKGWVDYVHNGASVGVTKRKRYIQAMAAAGMSPSECTRKGFHLEIEDMRPDQRKYFQTLCARIVVRPLLKAGMQFMLGCCTFQGSKGPFVISEDIQRARRQRIAFVGEYGYATYARFVQVDWLETAKLNNIELPAVEVWNKVGPVKPPRER
jgi:hypothetical protein